MNTPVAIKLFDWQTEKVEEVFRLIAEGHRRILVVSPTGSGKTVLASEIYQAAQYRAQRSPLHRTICAKLPIKRPRN